ncbi:SLATT domain-containing protein [Pseudobdellovibrio sp. HCB154]|uniref:SLATT domain-containing protein n=1 Tax=Pseudobdellovibrio sp. HCB154 TaxID=3386277 RepID=UPI003917278C
MNNLLEDQIRQCFGRVVYTHKTHEKMADLLIDRLGCYKTAQIVLNVITTGGVVTLFKNDQEGTKIVTAIVSAISLFVTAYLKSFDMGSLAQKHRDAALKILNIRESYLSLLVDIRSNLLVADAIVKKRDDLQKQLVTVYSSAPSTNFKAYSMAQKALKEYEEYTFSDSEIDKFLPENLRKSTDVIK